jgi:hypothetical protein
MGCTISRIRRGAKARELYFLVPLCMAVNNYLGSDAIDDTLAKARVAAIQNIDMLVFGYGNSGLVQSCTTSSTPLTMLKL